MGLLLAKLDLSKDYLIGKVFSIMAMLLEMSELRHALDQEFIF